MELPSKKVVTEVEEKLDDKDDDHDPELNGIKRKRPPDVPEIPPKGIFSSSLFKSYPCTPLLSPKKPKGSKLDPPNMVKDRLVQNLMDKVTCIMDTNNRRCNACPLYGKDLIEAATIIRKPVDWPRLSQLNNTDEFTVCDLGHQLIRSEMNEVLEQLKGFFNRYFTFQIIKQHLTKKSLMSFYLLK